MLAAVAAALPSPFMVVTGAVAEAESCPFVYGGEADAFDSPVAASMPITLSLSSSDIFFDN